MTMSSSGSTGEWGSSEMLTGEGTPIVIVIEGSVRCFLRHLVMREKWATDWIRKIILQAEKGRMVIHPVVERREGPCKKWGK